LQLSPSDKTRVFDTLGSDDSDAPEMREAHERWFEQDPADIYGSSDDWSPVKRSGHFRRMRLLDNLELGDITQKTAADFGVGPWGFACVFPKLRDAMACYGFDVSSRALEISAEADAEIADKTRYYTSDGEIIPLDEDSVDIFWGGEVIEHVREPRRFAEEIARVCRDGSHVILSTPNREALYYFNRGEDHAIGPEHIALMNLGELLAVLQLFFNDIEITGYETSLHPDLDSELWSEAALRLIQERAAAHPQTASGVLVSARVDKSRYRRNRLSWDLTEYLWTDSALTSEHDADPMRLFEGVAGGGLKPSQIIELDFQGDRLVLLFWAHDWSGHATITLDDETQLVDLYSPWGGFRRVAFEGLSKRSHRLTIGRLGGCRDSAHDDQVIFYKAMTYQTGRRR
jgi:SAM-dependent methyltransferase